VVQEISIVKCLGQTVAWLIIITWLVNRGLVLNKKFLCSCHKVFTHQTCCSWNSRWLQEQRRQVQIGGRDRWQTFILLLVTYWASASNCRPKWRLSVFSKAASKSML
jgi:hypothetical protein